MPNPLSLTQFDQEYLDILSTIEEAEGELTPELEEKLDDIVAEQVKNTEKYILTIKHFDATMESLKQLEQKFAQKRRSIEKEKDRWKTAMIMHLDALGYKTKLQCEIGKVNAQGKKRVADDIRIEDLEPKYLIMDSRIRGIKKEELETALKSAGLDCTMIKDQIDKEMVYDDMTVCLKELPTNEAAEIEQNMWEGLVYTNNKVPGGRLTVTKFPRIY